MVFTVMCGRETRLLSLFNNDVFSAIFQVHILTIISTFSDPKGFFFSWWSFWQRPHQVINWHLVFVVVQDIGDPAEESLHGFGPPLFEIIEVRDDELGGVVSAVVVVEVGLDLIPILRVHSSDLHTAIPFQSKTPERVVEIAGGFGCVPLSSPPGHFESFHPLIRRELIFGRIGIE